MSLRMPAPESMQPNRFKFTKKNVEKIKSILKKYPSDRKASALLPLLDIAQRQNENWLPIEAMNEVGKILDIPMIKILEVATFYTMFNLSPVGKNLIQICGTTPCWLKGSDKIVEVCKNKLGINYGETTKDNLFTLTEVECLGACSNAPMVQINDSYYEDLTEQSMTDILINIEKGKKLKKGPQTSRRGSEPIHIKEKLNDI
tara:strand:- start:76 stop:681 length:606 start_codon:yes stop_codon:yes gene_type:complete